MRGSSVVSIVVLLAVAGCTSTPGKPMPEPGSSSQQVPSTTGQASSPAVPKVANPIDTTRFKGAPCDALTSAQVAELFGPGVEPKTDLAGVGGPSCRLDSPSTDGAHLSVIFGSLSLADFYRAKDTTYPFFRELPSVEGYPVVAYDIAGDHRSEGQCQVALGTSDTAAVGFGVMQAQANIGRKDPCEAARDVASMALANMRRGN